MKWIKSSRCDSGQCIEVWDGHATVWVRDSTRPDAGEILVVGRGDWQRFLTGLPELSR